MSRYVSFSGGIWRDMISADLLRQAAAMSYVTLLSLVPSIASILAFASWLSPFVTDNQQISMRLQNLILQHLTAGTGNQVLKTIEFMIRNTSVRKIGLTGFAGAVVILLILLKQTETAFNHIFRVTSARGQVGRAFRFAIFFVIVSGLIMGSLSAFSSFGAMNWLRQLGMVKSRSDSLISHIASFASVWVFYLLAYKTIPNTYVRASSAAIGAIFAAASFKVATLFYGEFITRFTNYQAIYGALAVLPTFLLWLYVLWIITFAGAIFTYRAQTAQRL